MEPKRPVSCSTSLTVAGVDGSGLDFKVVAVNPPFKFESQARLGTTVSGSLST